MKAKVTKVEEPQAKTSKAGKPYMVQAIEVKEEGVSRGAQTAIVKIIGQENIIKMNIRLGEIVEVHKYVDIINTVGNDGEPRRVNRLDIQIEKIKEAKQPMTQPMTAEEDEPF